MANYNAITRTNYFKVTDIDKWHELADMLVSDEGDDVDISENDNVISIACYGDLNAYRIMKTETDDDDFYEDNESIWDEWLEDLSKIIAEGDACIITNIGNEKLRYVGGTVTIITNNHIEYIDLGNMAINTVRTLLNNPNWDTKNAY